MIGPAGFMSGPKERPKYGTSLIRCAKRKCKWEGLETELVSMPMEKGVCKNVCPACGGDGYYFVEPKE